MKTTNNKTQDHNAIDISAGAPAPSPSSRFWNDWAANNPTSAARALGNFNVEMYMKASLLNPTGVLGRSARPID